jgi:hypothetical protein
MFPWLAWLAQTKEDDLHHTNSPTSQKHKKIVSRNGFTWIRVSQILQSTGSRFRSAVDAIFFSVSTDFYFGAIRTHHSGAFAKL